MERTVLYLLIGLAVIRTWTVTQCAEIPPDDTRVFAMTFMDMGLEENDASFTQIMISTTNRSTIRVKVPFAFESKFGYVIWSATDQTYFNFTADEIDFIQNAQEQVVDNKGAIVVTKDTVGVFGSHAMAGSGDGYLSLPLIRRSHTFYLASYPTVRVMGHAFYGLAAAAETCVQVYRPVNASFKLHKSITLSAGDVYQEYGAVDGDDFTGWKILASQGVAVLSGHECAQVPAGFQFCDHLLEQMPPVHEWDEEMVVPGLPGRNPAAGYRVRVVSGADQTTVNCTYGQQTKVLLDQTTYGCNCTGNGTENIEFVQCTEPCTISAGRFVELHVTNASQPITVRCTPSCLVVMYGHSRQVASTEPDDPDAFTAVITPTSRYGNDMTYVTPDYTDPSSKRLLNYANHLAIVVPKYKRDGVRLDDAELPSDVATVAVDEYTVIQLTKLRYGQHRIRHVDPGVKIGAFAFGNTLPLSAERAAARSSYGFPVVYTIGGETIKGDWLTELTLQAGDDVITPPPRECVQIEEDSVHDTFTVATNVNYPSCTSGILTQAALESFRLEVNRAICEDIICAGLPDSVFVSHMRLPAQSTITQVDIRMVTTMDTPMESLFQCKKDIISYMTYPDHWVTVLSADAMTYCRDVIQQLRHAKNTFSCPITTTY